MRNSLDAPPLAAETASDCRCTLRSGGFKVGCPELANFSESNRLFSSTDLAITLKCQSVGTEPPIRVELVLHAVNPEIPARQNGCPAAAASSGAREIASPISYPLDIIARNPI